MALNFGIHSNTSTSKNGATTSDMFLTAKEKSYNDNELTKKMIDTVDGLLRPSLSRIEKINEAWHLHGGKWPELDLYLGDGGVVIREEDGNGVNMNMNDFITHHPKINNITNFIHGDIIMQPLIPIVKDFSAHGRKYREEEMLRRLKEYYYEKVYVPQAELVKAQYMQSNNIQDMLTLTPDEQRQVQADLQQRINNAIPRSIIDDLKKVTTPDEKIRQVLLNYDIEAYDLYDVFIRGGEQAVVAYEEYYRIGVNGIKPTIEVLNSKWVTWAGDDTTDYCEDGVMAKYEQYLTPQTFVEKYGREAIKNKDFLKDIGDYFKEIPGVFRSNKGVDRNMFIEEEMDFVDAIGANPSLIQQDWRTLEGQREIARLYSDLSSHYRTGSGIKETYVTFKWTETMNYVQRVENGKVKEYFFSAEYKRDKTKDIKFSQFPISRVYHGTKVADRFYVNVCPVPWQYYGSIYEYKPKLTIAGRKYSKSNGVEQDNTLIGPAIQYQLRYNITASKLEELEKADIGKIMLWDTSMRPNGWSHQEYISMMLRLKNVPYTKYQTGQDKNSRPFYVEDAGSTSKMNEYRENMAFWENEMYKAVGINRDSLGMANQYQSNAMTQSNISGSQKQLLPFHNKRRQLKERVLNYFSNVSMICFLDDKDKQDLLLDDFSRLHLDVNSDDIRGHNTSIFVVDDYGEAQNVERIRGQILSMIQNGTSIKDIISFMKAKSVAEMYEIAEIAEIKSQEQMQEAQQSQQAQMDANNKAMQEMAEFQEQLKTAREDRANQVKLEMAELNSKIMYNAADVDKNNVADSLQSKKLEIASREKIEMAKLEVEREKIRKQTKI